MRESAPVRLYLQAYNFAQFLLWSYALISALRAGAQHFSIQTHASISAAAVAASHKTVLRAQTLAWAEVVHAALRLAGGGVAAAFVQSLGRYVVVACVIDALPPAQLFPATAVLYIAWATADIVRYALYLSTAISRPAAPPRVLVWLRYSLFIVLQPIGIVSEWLVYLLTLPYVESEQLYRVRLPNAYNFAFDFASWNRIVLLLYFYFGPFMMRHMLRLRRAKLGSRRHAD